jgi:adenylate cyclase
LIELVTETREGLAPQRRSVAVMDCDLVSFSGAAEAMAPEAVASVLSLFRATVAEAVFARDGAVLSTVGDGVTAVFGLATPPGLATAHAFDAARAVHESWSRAAVMAGAVQLPAAAIGVDTGEAQVGVVGAGRSMSLLMQGGPIGTAARLQNATRAAGVPLLLSEASSRALPPDASARLQRVTTEAGDAFGWSA